jgi:hypothetical protein
LGVYPFKIYNLYIDHFIIFKITNNIEYEFEKSLTLFIKLRE